MGSFASRRLGTFARAAIAGLAGAVSCASGACNGLNGSGDLAVHDPDAAALSAGDARTSADGPVVGTDAGVDGLATDADGSLPPVGCDLTKSFLAPTLVAGVNSAVIDEGARLSPDELTLYFSSDRGASSDIYVASRTNVKADFGAPQLLFGVDANAELRFPSVRGDGLALYAKVTGGGGAGLGDVFFATRKSAADPFGPLTQVPVINQASDDGNPFIRQDGAILYFGSTRTGGTDIYRTVIDKLGVVAAPALVTELASPANDTAPVVTPDDLTIYFGSSRASPAPGGGRDIFVARRASTAQAFGTPVIVPQLSSTADDLPTWASADGCRVYLSSDRGGNMDIYLARRP